MYTANVDPALLLTAAGDFLDALVHRPAWQKSAACRDTAGQIDWFASNAHRPPDIEAAKGVCAHCPVRTQCEAFAMADPLLQGVWGGLTDQDRRRLRKGRA